MESILDTIKAMLGPVFDYQNVFETDLIVHINSAIGALTQLGVGPKEGYRITGATETWADFMGENELLFEMAKTYIYLKVKLVFDPPSTSFVIQAYENQIKELEWRIAENFNCFVPNEFNTPSEGGDADDTE